MIRFVIMLTLWLQGAPAPQQSGVIVGQLQAKDGSFPTGVRVSALTVPVGTNNMGPETGLNYFEFGPAASVALTDAQGRYRLENVPPGRYYVLGGLTGQPSYYTDAGNQNRPTVITMTAGQTIQNIDFKLQADLGRTVSGRFNLGSSMKRDQTAVLTGSKVEEFLQMPLRPDGSFEFGRVPSGSYLLTTFPPPPGLEPLLVIVGNADVKNLDVAPPVTRTVTGKIVMQNGGPIPNGLLGFYNAQSYVGATVNPDGSFTAKLHPARHTADFAGLPVGYDLLSVQNGSTDVTKGFTVGSADVAGLVITVKGPAALPRVTGKITGLAADRLAAAKVELTGPIFGAMLSSIRSDGSFEFPKVVPGLYKARLLQVAEFPPTEVVITYKPRTELQLTVPGR